MLKQVESRKNPSKIEWDLTNGPLGKLLELKIVRLRGPFSGSCWIFLGKNHRSKSLNSLSCMLFGEIRKVEVVFYSLGHGRVRFMEATRPICSICKR